MVNVQGPPELKGPRKREEKEEKEKKMKGWGPWRVHCPRALNVLTTPLLVSHENILFSTKNFEVAQR